MPLVYDGPFRLYKVPMGPYDNNTYILADRKTSAAYIVDTPGEPEKLLAESHGLQVQGILVTHNHWDHLVGLPVVQRATGAPVGVHDADRDRLPLPPDFSLKDGDILTLGETKIRVLYTPGHTPGSVCLLVGKRLIAGDTLFPGGPGRTGDPKSFRQILQSITQKLLLLEDDVVVHPGHGSDTTIGQARREYHLFAGREHTPDLCCDVLWLKS